jgi:hypothetical protein
MDGSDVGVAAHPYPSGKRDVFSAVGRQREKGTQLPHKELPFS